MRGFRSGAALLALFVLAAPWFSCSASLPKIRQIFFQLNYYEDSRDYTWREALSLFLDIENKDGIQEVDKINLLSDDSELYWQLDSDSWEKVDRDGSTWLGSNLILMPSEDRMPRGSYRIVVNTKSGNRAEGAFNLKAPFLRDYHGGLFEVYQHQDQILLNPPKASFLVWVYGADRKLLGTYKGTGGRATKAQIQSDPLVGNKGATYFVYVFDESQGVGMINGPYAF